MDSAKVLEDKTGRDMLFISVEALRHSPSNLKVVSKSMQNKDKYVNITLHKL